MANALTVDVEDWYHGHDLDIDPHRWDSLEDRIERSTGAVLDLLSRHGARATFFVLGHVARRHPAMVREIASAGHEIGSHGDMHRLVYSQDRVQFREDLLASRRTLEDITGRDVKIYRAPSWSISKSSLWALEILEEEGFTCDSSVQPFKTPLYGIDGAPVFPYHPVIGGRRLEILEFPPTVLPLGPLRLPFAGGLYLRALPVRVVALALGLVNRGRPGMVYVHPWEMDPGQPRIRVPAMLRLIHYLNLEQTKDKLGLLLNKFRFVPLGDLVESGGYPAAPVIKNGGEY